MWYTRRVRPSDLPERWKTRVREYLAARGDADRTELNAFDFFAQRVAKLKFDDGSFAEFRYPLVIEAPELNEVAVFTEHCGYHLFSMVGTHVLVEDVD